MERIGFKSLISPIWIDLNFSWPCLDHWAGCSASSTEPSGRLEVKWLQEPVGCPFKVQASDVQVAEQNLVFPNEHFSHRDVNLPGKTRGRENRGWTLSLKGTCKCPPTKASANPFYFHTYKPQLVQKISIQLQQTASSPAGGLSPGRALPPPIQKPEPELMDLGTHPPQVHPPSCSTVHPGKASLRRALSEDTISRCAGKLPSGDARNQRYRRRLWWIRASCS